MPPFLVADLFPGHKHRCVRSCGRASQGLQFVPGGGGEQDRARLAALAEGRNLAGITSLLHVLPFEVAEFGHAQPPGIQQPEQNAVSGSGFQGQHLLHVRFLKDALGQAASEAGQAEGCPNVYREDSDAMPKGKEGLDAGECSGSGRGGKFVLTEHIGKSLNIGESCLSERFAGEEQESPGIGLVGALGMCASSVEPETDELGVGVLQVWAWLQGCRSRCSQSFRE